jgi:predicted transcriptional regulator of viral defense system
MKALDALNIIQDITSQQWGMFTSAQAVARGIDRMALSRLMKNGHIERLRKGIYRASAVPSSRLEAVYAAWLSIEPSQLSYKRSKKAESDAVVSCATAAYVWSIGELNPEPITFSVNCRKQLRDKGIRTIIRHLDERDVTIAQGLPTTTIERTIADLITSGTDLSLVANVAKDALRLKGLDAQTMIEYLSPLAKRAGCKSGDGLALYERLLGQEGIHVR